MHVKCTPTLEIDNKVCTYVTFSATQVSEVHGVAKCIVYNNIHTW